MDRIGEHLDRDISSFPPRDLRLHNRQTDVVAFVDAPRFESHDGKNPDLAFHASNTVCRYVPTWRCRMAIRSVSSRELNHGVSSAKKAAQDGPVIITDRGKPSHVLMTYSEFERLTGQRRHG